MLKGIVVKVYKMIEIIGIDKKILLPAKNEFSR
jgi:hypothetical protein